MFLNISLRIIELFSPNPTLYYALNGLNKFDGYALVFWTHLANPEPLNSPVVYLLSYFWVGMTRMYAYFHKDRFLDVTLGNDKMDKQVDTSRGISGPLDLKTKLKQTKWRNLDKRLKKEKYF